MERSKKRSGRLYRPSLLHALLLRLLVLLILLFLPYAILLLLA